jgi:hypothetical protein
MDRRRLRRWAMGAVLLAAFFGIRQYQLSYARVLPVHLEVLTYTAAKLCTLIASGRGLSTEGMAEYVYPARRGRDFLARYAGSRERPSYGKLQLLLDDYEGLVRDADAARASGQDLRSRLTEFEARRDRLFAQAEEVRNDLRRE